MQDKELVLELRCTCTVQQTFEFVTSLIGVCGRNCWEPFFSVKHKRDSDEDD